MKYLKLFILAACLLTGLSGLLRAQTGNPSTSSKFVLKNDAGNTVTLAVPSTGVTNYSLTLPAITGTTGGMLYLTNGTGSLGWLAAGTNNQVLTMSGGIPTWSTLSAGTVSSVGLVMPSIFTVTNSPITSSGNLTATLNTQNANLFFAGPSSGAAATPTFRAITSADVPALPYLSSVGLTMPSVLYSSVTNSPLTSNGTLIPQLATQTANFVFAGPTSGAATTPTFRALVANDIPSGSTNYIQNTASLQPSSNFHISGNGEIETQLQFKGTGTGITTFQAGAQGATNLNYTLPITAPTAGQILSSSASGVLSWTNASAGTVTSVGLAMPSIFTVTNSPVTTSGTLTAALNNQNANLFFAGPSSGAAATPTFRLITATDVPALPYVSSIGLQMPSVLYSSVTNSPLTSNGTLIPQLATQTANFVFAGPTTGAAATPTFRALVANDIPSGSTSYIQNTTSLQPSSNYHISGNGEVEGQLQFKGTSTGITTFQGGAQGANNINYTLPSAAPNSNQVLISSGGSASNLSWTDASTLLSGSYWSLAGNSTATAYNGTTGNFLGTTSTQPLVIATTNTATAQPIELFTNNVERMRVASSGYVGVGLTTPTSILHVASQEDNDAANDVILSAFNGTATNGGEFVTQRARGTIASPTNVASGDDLGGFKYRGYFNGSFIEAGQIDFIADAAPTAAGLANHFLLNTSDGSNMTQRLYITSGGFTAIGTNSPNTQLDVDGAISTRPSTSTITATSTVTVGNRSYVRLTHDANAGTYTITLSNGLQDGQVLIIQVEGVLASPSRLLQFSTSANLKLSGTFAPNTNHSTLSLIWDGTEWVETARSLN